MAKMWNLWHGCKKFSAGYANCYVYRSDERYEREASKVVKTQAFDLPVHKTKSGGYTHKSGTMFWTCFTSDFLLDEKGANLTGLPLGFQIFHSFLISSM